MFTKKQFFALSTLLCVFATALPLFTFAQFDPPPGVPEGPIDGGLSLLVAAGVGYGAKKLKDRRQQIAK